MPRRLAVMAVAAFLAGCAAGLLDHYAYVNGADDTARENYGRGQ